MSQNLRMISEHFSQCKGRFLWGGCFLNSEKFVMGLIFPARVPFLEDKGLYLFSNIILIHNLQMTDIHTQYFAAVHSLYEADFGGISNSISLLLQQNPETLRMIRSSIETGRFSNRT